MSRREQFNIKTDNMPEEVYRVFQEKAEKRQLKWYLIELVQRDLHGGRSLELQDFIQEIKNMEKRLLKALRTTGPSEESQQLHVQNMQQLSTNELVESLDDDDLGYDF